MKYILAIALGTIVIGSLLSLGVYFLFGENLGYFFVKFIAVPAGAELSLRYYYLLPMTFYGLKNKDKKVSPAYELSYL